MGQAMATTEGGEGAYHNIMAELYVTDIPGFTNFMRMIPEFFEIIKTRLEPCLARQATNYRAPFSVGEKLALAIRYLATGESYTSLSCQLRVSRSTISKFLPEAAGPSRMNSPESTSDVLHGWSQLCPGHNCVLKFITKRECTHFGALVKFLKFS